MQAGFVTIRRKGCRYHGRRGMIQQIEPTNEFRVHNGQPYDLLHIKLERDAKVVRVPSYFVPEYDATAH
jgi:hypothetical protein